MLLNVPPYIYNFIKISSNGEINAIHPPLKQGAFLHFHYVMEPDTSAALVSPVYKTGIIADIRIRHL